MEWLTSHQYTRPETVFDVKILGFGKKEPKKSLDSLVLSLNDEIGERALGRLVDPENPRRELWGVILLGNRALHVIYGESVTWMGKLFGGTDQDQKLISLPLTEIANLVLPGKRSWIARILAGPTAVLTIDMKDGASLRLEIDRREPLLAALDAAVTGTIA